MSIDNTTSFFYSIVSGNESESYCMPYSKPFLKIDFLEMNKAFSGASGTYF